VYEAPFRTARTKNTLSVCPYRKQTHPSCHKTSFVTLGMFFCPGSFLGILWKSKNLHFGQVSLNLTHCAPLSRPSRPRRVLMTSLRSLSREGQRWLSLCLCMCVWGGGFPTLRCGFASRSVPDGQRFDFWSCLCMTHMTQSCFQKSAFYSSIRIFNSLPYSVTKLKNEKAQFIVALRRHLMHTVFPLLTNFLCVLINYSNVL
jgi:hypothetical protein